MKNALIDSKIDIKFKLSALWMLIMMIYIYTDFYTLYVPGKIEEMMSGIMDVMTVSQSTLLMVSVVTIIPALMIFLSLVLKSKLNRWVNIGVGLLNILIGVVNLIGATWGYYIFYGILLLVVPVVIVAYAWKWPRVEGAGV